MKTAATSKQIGRILSGTSPDKMAGITESFESNTLNNDSIARATVEQNHNESLISRQNRAI